MRAADRFERLAEARPGAAQLAALEELRVLRARLHHNPADADGTVALGVFLAFEGLVRRDELHVEGVLAEAREWVAIFGVRSVGRCSVLLPERTADV